MVRRRRYSLTLFGDNPERSPRNRIGFYFVRASSDDDHPLGLAVSHVTVGQFDSKPARRRKATRTAVTRTSIGHCRGMGREFNRLLRVNTASAIHQQQPPPSGTPRRRRTDTRRSSVNVLTPLLRLVRAVMFSNRRPSCTCEVRVGIDRARGDIVVKENRN